jgi:translocation and assembly module TamA
VERRVQWRPGEPYDNRKVDETRKLLIESGLFSTVKITPANEPASDQAPMEIEVTERAHRTIGAGLAYNTSEGAGARVFWENRNLFGGAEYLRLALDVGQQKKDVGANFRRPDWLTTDQDLVASAVIGDDTPVAYHSRYVRMSSGIERRFRPDVTLGAAISIEKANVVQEANLGSLTAAQRTQHYSLIGVPLYLKLDRSDDLLNPSRGYRGQINFIPYRSFSGPDLTFAFGRISASTISGSPIVIATLSRASPRFLRLKVRRLRSFPRTSVFMPAAVGRSAHTLIRKRDRSTSITTRSAVNPAWS